MLGAMSLFHVEIDIPICSPVTYYSLVAQMVKRLATRWETQVRSLGWEDPLKKEWQPTPVLLPGKSHGRRRLVG